MCARSFDTGTDRFVVSYSFLSPKPGVDRAQVSVTADHLRSRACSRLTMKLLVASSLEPILPRILNTMIVRL